MINYEKIKYCIKMFTLSIFAGMLLGLICSVAKADEVNVITNSVFIKVYTQKGIATGSGFIASELNNYIITNKHVVKDAQVLKIIDFNKNESYAKVVYVSKIYDLAIIKPEFFEINAAGITLCKDSDVIFGDKLYNFGNPAGLEFIYTQGYISGIKRKVTTSNQEFLIHNLIGFSGQSGSAVILKDKHCVVSVLTSGIISAEIGFSITVEDLRIFIDEFKKSQIIKK